MRFLCAPTKSTARSCAVAAAVAAAVVSQRCCSRLSFHLNLKARLSLVASRRDSARLGSPCLGCTRLCSALPSVAAAAAAAVSCVVRNVSLTIIMSKIVRCSGAGCAVAAVFDCYTSFYGNSSFTDFTSLRRTQKAATATATTTFAAATSAAAITGMKWVKIELGALIASKESARRRGGSARE